MAFASHAAAADKPLRIYILAGQSNMEGHAMTRTFDYIGDDPATAPLLAKMRDDQGNPTVADRVYISNLTGIGENNGVLNGKLTAGFGARRNPAELGDKIGPEFTFGLTMQEHYDGPILIIKTAWGGKSLHTDFRPPSAGAYQFNQAQLDNWTKQGKDLDAIRAEKEAATGVYYRLMMDHVKSVLADLDSVVPGYTADQGYELAGFVWFQGWNDMVDSGTYPERGQPGGYNLYSRLFAMFIRDVRKDLGAEKLPFVIGVMGVGGEIDPDKPNATMANFRAAMAAPAQSPEFRGTVVAVETAPFWAAELAAIDDKRGQVRQMAHQLRVQGRNGPNADGSMSEADQKAYLEKYEAELITEADKALWDRGASNAGYHYLGCGKTMAQIGAAFAEALVGMQAK